MPRAWLRRHRAAFVLYAGSALTGLGFIALGSAGTETAYALMVLGSYTVVPLASLLLPLYAARQGMERYAAFFPPALFALAGWMAMGMTPPPATIPLSLGLGVLGSTAGSELRQQKRRPKKRK